ncbi:MAG: hypothetical protein JSU87_13805 [Gemmatimonadota bacterium]|nr:MAG: hypothetical protein JSU87_13805 [Gemmatimonadota bacterium]
MPKPALLTAVLAGLVFSGRLAAQGTSTGCPEIYATPKLGDYAELRIAEKTGVVSVRFAIVGVEEVEGRTHYWMEVLQTPPGAGWSVIAQILIPHFPFEQHEIKGYVVKTPDQPAVRVPLEMLEMMGGEAASSASWREACQTADYLGVERVAVPAGTISARHYRGAMGDLWLADVPFGTVKAAEPDMVTELVRYGRDAKSSITEKPQQLEMPPGPG